MRFSTKAEARRWARERLGQALPQEFQESARKVCACVIEWLAKNPSPQVFLFYPLAYELNLLPLVDQLPGTGFGLPAITGSQTMEFRKFDQVNGLERGPLGILAPNQGAKVLEASNQDIMLVPCIALTRSGKRLGHGRGYYDVYLKSLAAKPKLFGVSLECVLLNEGAWPYDDHDIPMDYFWNGLNFESVQCSQ